MKKKTIALLLALTLILGVAAGGTIAWLVTQTESVTNTFTMGDINIALTETTTDYKAIPGSTIAKDPKVTVKAGSEACWLFVKVKEEKWNTDLTYEIASGWTELTLTGVDYKVYYREVPATTADTDFAVLKDNQVKVSNALLKNEITQANAPQLIFTAYACQKDNVASAADAWAKASGN